MLQGRIPQSIYYDDGDLVKRAAGELSDQEV
jgi:hypothetical protein